MIVRRQDLVLPPSPNESLSAILPVSILLLIATATTLWSVEKLALTFKYRREINRAEFPIDFSGTVGFCKLTPLRSAEITDRTDKECNQWPAWVAAMTSRRRVRCMNSCRRPAATSR